MNQHLTLQLTFIKSNCRFSLTLLISPYRMHKTKNNFYHPNHNLKTYKKIETQTFQLAAQFLFPRNRYLSRCFNRCFNGCHKLRISCGSVGSYFPFFISRITVPDSNACTVCHWPAGMLRATTGPFGESSMRSVQVLSRSS